ncbi:Alpha-1,3-mannosyl-glycoprotein 4-beta-N-acetylglucosaminyltransferase C [Thelohanellus kitauei]|uniref:Alpha-1,3-mannosyl-glycoprotein 4-beta-N-acetylglucosaminyltransferase C n=1 Tax=Thelohanellus kitauei TaxID=669202 RepID=A0A0C2N154_THEKT|nr:Alpha-1,3-mannosyl-glycoprotein 4-beta-N-acetylglucosaminyltransferase C [Thelohanellus kitauei]
MKISLFVLLIYKCLCASPRLQDTEEDVCCLPNGAHFSRSKIKHYGTIKDNKNIVIVLPTIVRYDITKRPMVDYLLRTLESLMPQITDDICVLVFIGDIVQQNIEMIRNTLLVKYKSSLESGKLQIIEYGGTEFSIPLFIPPSRFVDTKNRIKWRSKQNIFTSFMYNYARSFGKYLLQLEDDTPPVPDMIVTVKNHIKACSNITWYQLSFSKFFGDIGLLFHVNFTKTLSRHLRNFYLEQPCDMLRHELMDIFRNQIPNQKNTFGCPVLELRYSLFNHIGKISTVLN